MGPVRLIMRSPAGAMGRVGLQIANTQEEEGEETLAEYIHGEWSPLGCFFHFGDANIYHV